MSWSSGKTAGSHRAVSASNAGYGQVIATLRDVTSDTRGRSAAQEGRNSRPG
jgi:hypothetical protein